MTDASPASTVSLFVMVSDRPCPELASPPIGVSVGWTRTMLALPAEEMSEAESTARQKRIFEARRSGDVRTLIGALTDDENRAWAARYLGEMADPDAGARSVARG